MKEYLDNLKKETDLDIYFNSSKPVFTEYDMVVGETILRTDRFLFTKENEVIILDYKTGQPNPEMKNKWKIICGLLSRWILK